jgi:hypothetical protein
MRLTFDKNGQRRGGTQKKAGRKPNGPRAGVSHLSRPAIDPRHPQHVTLRVTQDIGWLRKLDTYAAIRRALRVAMRKHDTFRIVHFTLQNTHVHLICEAGDKPALALGLQAFQISAAKQLNGAVSRRRRLPIRRRGRVFADRYHAEPLDGPTKVRNAISYVLNNWRRHGVDRDAAYTLLNGRLDPYASGLAFDGWRGAIENLDLALPATYEPPAVSEPSTWLMRVGWTKARPIGMFDVPGPHEVSIVEES